MKVIDLLNKIAKGEEVPKKIRYEGKDMFWCEPCKIYEVDVEQKELCGTDLYSILDNLNDEVEVIEEDKKIEPLECYVNDILTGCISKYYEEDFEETVKHNIDVLGTKINEIIDKINEMEVK